MLLKPIQNNDIDKERLYKQPTVSEQENVEQENVEQEPKEPIKSEPEKKILKIKLKQNNTQEQTKEPEPKKEFWFDDVEFPWTVDKKDFLDKVLDLNF